MNGKINSLNDLKGLYSKKNGDLSTYKIGLNAKRIYATLIALTFFGLNKLQKVSQLIHSLKGIADINKLDLNSVFGFELDKKLHSEGYKFVSSVWLMINHYKLTKNDLQFKYFLAYATDFQLYQCDKHRKPKRDAKKQPIKRVTFGINDYVRVCGIAKEDKHSKLAKKRTVNRNTKKAPKQTTTANAA